MRFRVNPLMAIEQDDKVRLVMNVSLPKEQSLNDNIDESKLEKVHMTSARSVSYLIKEAGKNAWISKMDKKVALSQNCAGPDGRIEVTGIQVAEQIFRGNSADFWS